MATYYWRGSAGSFVLPSDWMVADASGTLSSAMVAPGDADTVVFDTTGMALSADAEFAGVLQLNLGPDAALDLGGHTLSLLSTAQLGDSSSRIVGPGTLETEAISVVSPAAGNSPAVQFADGATWSNAGLVMDGGAVALGGGTGDAATISNQPGALFALAADQAGQIAAAPGSACSFVNDGTLAKTGGSGLSSVTAAVSNAGVISASSGTLELAGGGTLGGIIGGDTGQVLLAGTYALPSGATDPVSFAAGATLGAGADGAAVLSGSGTLASAGSVQIGSAGSAQVLLAGGASWDNAGTISAAGDLAFAATGGTLVNEAGALLSFTGTAGIEGSGLGGPMDGGDGDNSGVVNAAGAVMNIAANGQAVGGIGGIGNAGTMLVNGAGSLAVNTALTNTGSLVVTQGTLQLNGGGFSSGELLAGTDAALTFNGGSFGVTGLYSGINTGITGGTLDLSATRGDFRALLVSGGELALGSAAGDSSGLFQQSGGTLSGNGTFTACAGARFSGSVQTGPGTTRLLGASLIGGLALDGGHVLQNDGALTCAPGDILLGGGDTAAAAHSGTLFNTGVVDIAADSTIGVNPGGGTVDNAGVIAVAQGATIDAALVNSGVLTVEGGTLTLVGPVSGGGILQIGGGAAVDFAGAAEGDGSLRFLGGGGTLAVEQAGAFALPVSGFAAGDAVDLMALDFAPGPSLGFAAGMLTVDDGTRSAMVRLTGSYVASGFQLMNDGHGGVLVGYS